MESCPSGSISKVEIGGFRYPSIDPTNCMSCGRCSETCEVVHQHRERKAIFQYLFSSKDDNSRWCSSSGGLVQSLSRKTVSNGGIVYGVSYTKDFRRCYFTRATSTYDVQFQSRSKYFESEEIPF